MPFDVMSWLVMPILIAILAGGGGIWLSRKL